MSENEILLAVETSTTWSSSAVLRGGELLAETGTLIRKDHSGPLVRRIESMVRESGLSIDDVNSVIVSGGPGSFTGLRVGIGFAKGFICSTARQLFAVSSLETIAAGLTCFDRPICVMLDARKGEVYTATYRWNAGELQAVSEPASHPPEKVLENVLNETVFTGSGSIVYRDHIVNMLGEKALPAPVYSSFPRAGVMGQLVHKRPEHYLVKDPSTFEPMYIRPPEAVKKRQ